MIRKQRRPKRGTFPAPAVHGTNSQFMANRDDGFGLDDRSRRLARAKAKAAGMNVEGKVYSGQLATEALDPNAWYSSKDELAQKCRNMGAGCEELGVKQAEIISPSDDKPYKVDDALVRDAVAAVEADAGEPIRGKERKDLHESLSDEMSLKF